MSEQEKDLGGRPRFFDDPVKVEDLKKLLKLQCSMAECAGFLGCSPETVARFAKEDTNGGGFDDLLKKYGSETLISLRRAMLKKAIDGEVVAYKPEGAGKQWAAIKKTDTAMQIWLSKNMLGMSEKTDITIPDAKIKLSYKIDDAD